MATRKFKVVKKWPGGPAMKPTIIVYWSDEYPDPMKLYNAVVNVHFSEKRPDRMRSFFVMHDFSEAAEVLKETEQNDKRVKYTRNPLRHRAESREKKMKK